MLYSLLKLLIQPFTVGLLLLGVVTAIVCIRSRARRRIAAMVGLSYLAVLLPALSPVSYLALGSLEWQYSSLEEIPPDVPAIVVLGGRSQTVPRAAHAATLYRAGIHTCVIVSGGPGEPGEASEADIMCDLMTQLGVERKAMVVESQAQSTYENAVNCASILKERGLSCALLVTDAAHMPRAARCFRKQGIDVVPGITKPVTTLTSSFPGSILPNGGSVVRTEFATQEWAGLLWYRLCGRI